MSKLTYGPIIPAPHDDGALLRLTMQTGRDWKGDEDAQDELEAATRRLAAHIESTYAIPRDEGHGVVVNHLSDDRHVISFPCADIAEAQARADELKQTIPTLCKAVENLNQRNM